MPGPDLRQRVEVSDDDRTVATAEVTTSEGSGGTARVSLHAEPGHITPGRRASLVDAVLDLPEVQDSARVEAAFRLGDCESLHRLQERCEDVSTRPAGVERASSMRTFRPGHAGQHCPAMMDEIERDQSHDHGGRGQGGRGRNDDHHLQRAACASARNVVPCGPQKTPPAPARPSAPSSRTAAPTRSTTSALVPAASGASSRSTATARKWLSSPSPTRRCDPGRARRDCRSLPMSWSGWPGRR